MAEMMTSPKKGNRKVHSLKIDLTPMVDLGFLLITFFMYTTTMATPHTMAVNMPDRTPTPSPTAYIDTATITLMPAGAGKLYWYKGALSGPSQIKRAPMAAARGILQDHASDIAALPATFSPDAHQQHVLIKPLPASTYTDMVSLLDEMSILAVPYYTLADLNDDERALIVKIK